MESLQAGNKNLLLGDGWKVGDRILNRYEVRNIKQGGMGIVYICYDHEFRRKLVAIKTFQDRYFRNKTVIDHFKREAEIWVMFGRHTNPSSGAAIKTANP